MKLQPAGSQWLKERFSLDDHIILNQKDCTKGGAISSLQSLFQEGWLTIYRAFSQTAAAVSIVTNPVFKVGCKTGANLGE